MNWVAESEYPKQQFAIAFILEPDDPVSKRPAIREYGTTVSGWNIWVVTDSLSSIKSKDKSVEGINDQLWIF